MEDQINITVVILKLSKFIRQYIRLLVISLVFGLILGFIYTYSIRPQYKSNLVGISSILNTEDIYPILNKIKTLIRDENYDELKLHIPISVQDLRNVISIEVTSEIITSKKHDNQKQIKNKFNIEVVVSDYTLFDSLNIHLPQYIRNNKYTKLKNELVSYRKEKLYEKLEEEIKMLDSIKFVLFSSSISSKNATSIYLNNPSTINESIINLYDKKLEVYEALKLNQDFLVIEDFVTVRNPFNKKYIKNSLLSGLFCLILGFVFSIGREMYRFVSQY